MAHALTLSAGWSAHLVAKRCRAVVFALCSLGFGHSVAAQAPPTRRGEAFTFAVKLLGSIDAGRARLALSPPQPSPSGAVVRVVGESEALGMAKALTGWRQQYMVALDAATLLPKRIEQIDSGRTPREALFVVSGRGFDMTVKKPGGEWHAKGELKSELLDPMAVVVARVGCERPLVGGHHHVNAAVADRMG